MKKVQPFGVINGYYSNCTKTFISVISQNKPIATIHHERFIFSVITNNLFMHNGQCQVNIVEV